MSIWSLLPMLAGAAGKFLEKPGLTQEDILKKIPEWQNLMLQSGYAGIPKATQMTAEMVGKTGMTDESSAGIRYADIAESIAAGTRGAAEIGMQGTLGALQAPAKQSNAYKILSGALQGAPMAMDIYGAEQMGSMYDKMIVAQQEYNDILSGKLPKPAPSPTPSPTPSLAPGSAPLVAPGSAPLAVPGSAPLAAPGYTPGFNLGSLFTSGSSLSPLSLLSSLLGSGKLSGRLGSGVEGLLGLVNMPGLFR